MLITGQDEDMLFDIESAAEWHAIMIADGLLPFWVVTYDVSEERAVYRARPWTVPAHGNGGASPDAALYYKAMLVAPTQEAIRALLPVGMVMLPREKDDDPNVVEKWFS